MQGSVRTLKAALKLHNNYNSAPDKNNDTQKYTHIMHIINYINRHTPLN